MKAYVIYLPDRSHSVMHSAYMIKKLHEFGIDSELFEGTNRDQAIRRSNEENRVLYPYSIKQNELSDEEIKKFILPDRINELFSESYYIKIIKKRKIGNDKEKLSMPGVQGCFYSHYDLWKKCIEHNEPIMIFEDDVKFFRSWIPVEWEDILVLSLGKSSFLNEPYQTYLENPNGNPQPMPFKQFSMPGASGYAIKPAAAKILVKFYKKYFYPADNAINQSLVKIQIHNYIMGRNTTISEGNISMTRHRG